MNLYVIVKLHAVTRKSKLLLFHLNSNAEYKKIFCTEAWREMIHCELIEI